MTGQLWLHYFDAADLRQCERWGQDRHRNTRNIVDPLGLRGSHLAVHTAGVISEYAFKLQADARWGTDLEWVPFTKNFKELRADVGEHYQVRSSDKRWNNLLVYATDKPYQVFVLALLHDLPAVHLVGWAHGISAQQPKWRDNGKLRSPGFLYPQRFLAPMDGIPVPDDFL